MPTRVKYDRLPPGTHTWVFTEDRDQVQPDGLYRITGQPGVFPGDIVEVEDLNDPKSDRARIVRGHVEGIGQPGQPGYQPPVASIVKEERKSSPAPKPEGPK